MKTKTDNQTATAAPEAPIRMILTKDVERFPDFIAYKGMTGTFIGHRMGVSMLKMDAHLNGAENWDNCILWNEDSDYSRFIEDDTEPLFTFIIH